MVLFQPSISLISVDIIDYLFQIHAVTCYMISVLQVVVQLEASRDGGTSAPLVLWDAHVSLAGLFDKVHV